MLRLYRFDQLALRTRGQQLIDLQRAYENGAISRREYEREREKVLKEK